MSLTPRYQIQGGQPVSGRIRSLGAKNFATKAMVAALLAEGTTTLLNTPRIGDVEITCDLLVASGAKLAWSHEGNLQVDASAIRSARVPVPDSGSNRIPILLLGVLLHRLGEAHVPFVSGCNIGSRPVDFHLTAARMFGAEIEIAKDGYHARRSGPLRACHYTLPYPSVGGTESCLYLGVLAKGTSIIENVATEPEIIALITMLNAMGARIQLRPNRELVIEGVDKLYGTTFEVLGDRIEAASWAALAAATDGEITVDGIDPSTLINFFGPFNAVGGGVAIEGPKSIRFFRRHALKSIVLETDVFPGFATDWQQPFAVMLTQASGTSVIHETVYERRFDYLEALSALGAKTQIETHCLGSVACRFRGRDFPHSAMILGPTLLHSEGLTLDVPDLRAGLAYVMAAALATGETTITSIQRIERGYGALVERTRDLSIRIAAA
ncbi:MAG: UDP-N-acetylglucosamine 1-carboxyvinyltransferase [Betaproteobacteria bacterium]|nr:UDP-N-acetylglucosamine 1-carboxyvinyltransferase [Betaproteobacteria bacterium]